MQRYNTAIGVHLSILPLLKPINGPAKLYMYQYNAWPYLSFSANKYAIYGIFGSIYVPIRVPSSSRIFNLLTWQTSALQFDHRNIFTKSTSEAVLILF